MGVASATMPVGLPGESDVLLFCLLVQASLAVSWNNQRLGRLLSKAGLLGQL